MRARLAGLVLALLLALPAVTRADDTDIYTGSGVVPAGATPMVMFSVDTSTAVNATYAGCTATGAGTVASPYCAAAQYFKNNCSTCTLPASNAPLTYLHAIRYAIRMALLANTGVKVGLMLNHNHENNCAGPRPLVPTNAQKCSNGAYVARGFKLLDQVTIPGNALLGIPASVGPGANTTELLTILDSIPVPTNSSAHPFQGKELFFEFFRYLTGQAIYNGHNGYTDYGTNNTDNLNVDNPAIDWDASVEAASLYVSPLITGLSCAKIFTVNFILNGTASDNDSDSAIDSDSAGGMIGLDLSGQNGKFQNVVGYLHDVDLARAALPFGTVPTLTGTQNVTSYFLALPTPLNSSPATFDQETTGWAQSGGTLRPLSISSDPATLVDTVKSTLNQILSVSTSFVSASVPVNVFNRTQVLNDVYTSLFQPDVAAKPFWSGNVKKLKTQVFDVPCAVGAPAGCTPTKQVRLVDALGNDAIADDGRIRADALTFWTDGSTIAANPSTGVVAGRDGRQVALGGAGQRIPGFNTASIGLANSTVGARQMWLYPGSGGSLVPLSADAASAATYQVPLGAATAAEALQILKSVRGADSYDLDGDLNTAEARAWLMADPLHSRPTPVNYGALTGYSSSNPAIFIAVATNDGLLHFIRNTTTTPAESGVEQWAFLPFDLLNIQKVLSVNNPVTSRVYGLDGTPTAYIKDVNGDGTVDSTAGDRVYLFVGMRRGGRAYYALDVTNPTSPVFLWRITPTAHATSAGDVATTDFAQLGYTFSQPRLARVRTGTDVSGNAIIKVALVFGGGYDATANDYTLATKTLISSGLPSTGSANGDDTMGNAIFVVDAATGDLIWKAVGPVSGVLPTSSATVFPHALLKDSIPSTVTVVDTNSDGLTDRAVVGDTGGNVWRVDLGGNDTASWKLTLLAKLGRASGETGSAKLHDRRFFHEPDYVLSQDEHGPFDAIILGSGDREDPLDYGRERSAAGVDTLTENAMFMLKDRRVAVGAGSDSNPLTPSLLADATDDCTQDLSIARASCTPDFTNGWRVRLTAGKGEKVLAGALTAANRIYFTSYLPANSNDATTCGPAEGGGLFYAVGLKKATAVFNYYVADGGSSASPNSAKDRSQLLASSGIPAEVVYINVPDATGAEVRCALASDMTCRAIPGATRFRTFWYRDE